MPESYSIDLAQGQAVTERRYVMNIDSGVLARYGGLQYIGQTVSPGLTKELGETGEGVLKKDPATGQDYIEFQRPIVEKTVVVGDKEFTIRGKSEDIDKYATQLQDTYRQQQQAEIAAKERGQTLQEFAPLRKETWVETFQAEQSGETQVAGRAMQEAALQQYQKETGVTVTKVVEEQKVTAQNALALLSQGRNISGYEREQFEKYYSELKQMYPSLPKQVLFKESASNVFDISGLVQEEPEPKIVSFSAAEKASVASQISKKPVNPYSAFQESVTGSSEKILLGFGTKIEVKPELEQWGFADYEKNTIFLKYESGKKIWVLPHETAHLLYTKMGLSKDKELLAELDRTMTDEWLDYEPEKWYGAKAEEKKYEEMFALGLSEYFNRPNTFVEESPKLASYYNALFGISFEEPKAKTVSVSVAQKAVVGLDLSFLSPPLPVWTTKIEKKVVEPKAIEPVVLPKDIFAKQASIAGIDTKSLLAQVVPPKTQPATLYPAYGLMAEKFGATPEEQQKYFGESQSLINILAAVTGYETQKAVGVAEKKLKETITTPEKALLFGFEAKVSEATGVTEFVLPSEKFVPFALVGTKAEKLQGALQGLGREMVLDVKTFNLVQAEKAKAPLVAPSAITSKELQSVLGKPPIEAKPTIIETVQEKVGQPLIGLGAEIDVGLIQPVARGFAEPYLELAGTAFAFAGQKGAEALNVFTGATYAGADIVSSTLGIKTAGKPQFIPITEQQFLKTKEVGRFGAEVLPYFTPLAPIKTVLDIGRAESVEEVVPPLIGGITLVAGLQVASKLGKGGLYAVNKLLGGTEKIVEVGAKKTLVYSLAPIQKLSKIGGIVEKVALPTVFGGLVVAGAVPIVQEIYFGDLDIARKMEREFATSFGAFSLGTMVGAKIVPPLLAKTVKGTKEFVVRDILGYEAFTKENILAGKIPIKVSVDTTKLVEIDQPAITKDLELVRREVVQKRRIYSETGIVEKKSYEIRKKVFETKQQKFELVGTVTATAEYDFFAAGLKGADVKAAEFLYPKLTVEKLVSIKALETIYPLLATKYVKPSVAPFTQYKQVVKESFLSPEASQQFLLPEGAVGRSLKVELVPKVRKADLLPKELVLPVGDLQVRTMEGVAVEPYSALASMRVQKFFDVALPTTSVLKPTGIIKFEREIIKAKKGAIEKTRTDISQVKVLQSLIDTELGTETVLKGIARKVSTQTYSYPVEEKLGAFEYVGQTTAKEIVLRAVDKPLKIVLEKQNILLLGEKEKFVPIQKEIGATTKMKPMPIQKEGQGQIQKQIQKTISGIRLGNVGELARQGYLAAKELVKTKAETKIETKPIAMATTKTARQQRYVIQDDFEMVVSQQKPLSVGTMPRQIELYNERLKVFDLTKAFEKQTSKLDDLLLQKDFSKVLDKQLEKQLDRQLEKSLEKQTEKQLERQFEKQLERQMEKQLEKQLEKQIEKQVFKMPTIIVPPTKPPFGFPLLDEDFLGTQSPEEGYNVLVSYGTKKKRWQKLNKKVFDRESALNFGSAAVDNSAQKTFKIIETSKPAEQQYNQYDFGANFQKFKSKGNNVYMEKKEFGIDTAGEIKGITAKGWAARSKQARTQKLRGLLF